MKILIFIFLTLWTVNLFAQVTSSKEIKRTKPRVNKSKFSLEFLIAGEQTKDIITHKTDGSMTKMDSSLLQSLNDNNQLRYFFSTRYITNTEQESEFDFWFTEFMYRRKNILTESAHGVYLEAEFKNLYYLDPEIRKMYGYNGSTIPQLVFNKRFGKTFSSQLRLRRHFNHTNNNDAYTLDNEDRIYLSGNWMLGRRMMFNTQLKYQHKIRKGDGKDFRFHRLIKMVKTPYYEYPDFSDVPEAKRNQELVTIHPGFYYFVNRKTLFEVYYETKLSNTYDKRDVATIAKDESVIGTALYLSAF